jgi:recombination protein RecA
MAKKKSEKVATRSVQDILQQFNKLNKTEIMVMDETDIKNEVPHTSFGSLKLDIASGIGGAPHGRMVEIFGPESSGKSTICIQTCAEVQKKGGMVFYCDFEHALDPSYCSNLGFDLSKALLLQPDSGEQGLNSVEDMCKVFGEGDIIVIDSVAAITPVSEINGEMGDAQMGAQARLMSQACRKLNSIVGSSGVILLWVNQIRSKLGVTYGSNETTSGGNALKFFASMRLDIRRTKTHKDKDGIATHNDVRVKFIKNKLAPPFREASTIVRYGEGIPYEEEIVDLAEGLDLVSKSGGGWYSYGELKAQGLGNFVEALKEAPEVFAVLEKGVKEHYGF